MRGGRPDQRTDWLHVCPEPLVGELAVPATLTTATAQEHTPSPALEDFSGFSPASSPLLSPGHDSYPHFTDEKTEAESGWRAAGPSCESRSAPSPTPRPHLGTL